jgi:hypothetical protein
MKFSVLMFAALICFGSAALAADPTGKCGYYINSRGQEVPRPCGDWRADSAPPAGQRPNAGTARGVGASTHMRPVCARVMAASTAIAELLSHSVRDDCDANDEGDGNAGGNDPTQSIARKFRHLEHKYRVEMSCRRG